MKLERVQIDNYRAIRQLDLPLDPGLTVLHGNNAHGKTSVLSAIATGRRRASGIRRTATPNEGQDRVSTLRSPARCAIRPH